MVDNIAKVITVNFYTKENGKEPVREWLKSLNKEERRIIGEDIKMMQGGWPLGMPLVRSLGKGIWEIRSTLPNTIARVLFIMFEGKAVLLHGFIKKTQKTPKDDIEIYPFHLKGPREKRIKSLKFQIKALGQY